MKQILKDALLNKSLDEFHSAIGGLISVMTIMGHRTASIQFMGKSIVITYDGNGDIDISTSKTVDVLPPEPDWVRETNKRL